MVKQLLFIISAVILAVVITRSVRATPLKDIAQPERIDEAVAGLALPADR